MIAGFIRSACAAGCLGAAFVVPVSADDVPTLQIGPSCEAAGRGAVVLGRSKESCIADETAARDALKKNWVRYSVTDKQQCLGMEKTGGPASYVELLSCLEIRRDAQDMRKAGPLESPLSTRPSRR
ncbi:MAG: hypothetical protein JO228_11690 [Xanthobacteraceae bacterium]|nr:hypothetical protein [Xanthobacteraceae bacterium]